MPVGVTLRYEDGVYAIDSTKFEDDNKETILMRMVSAGSFLPLNHSHLTSLIGHDARTFPHSPTRGICQAYEV